MRDDSSSRGNCFVGQGVSLNQGCALMFIRSIALIGVRNKLSAPGMSPSPVNWFREAAIGIVGLLVSVPAAAFTLVIRDSDFVVTPVFSNVEVFSIRIEIDELFERRVYDNPIITSVNYQVSGVLEPGTPSGFPSFALSRIITGAEFYAQGSSLQFEIASNAVLSDGLQVAELAGNGIVFTFNGREIDNGRYHPALLELNGNGTGMIQNSNNIPTQGPPPVEVDFGEEYITNLAFDPGNLTIVEAPVTIGSSGSSAVSPLMLVLLAGLWRRRLSAQGM